MPVSVRVAEHAGNVYLDLCNPQWEVVEITPTGWEILPGDQAPVKFRRPRGIVALPQPIKGGRLEDLQSFLGVREERYWYLVVGFLLMMLRPRGPYPLLILHGEQGSGKSTRARIIRSIIDPNTVLLQVEPRETRDLMITAKGSWCLDLDNLTYLPVWLSDALCRLATGGGFRTRGLYTNDEEQLFDSMRPVIINGIEVVARKPDLLDRSLLVELIPITSEGRRTEEELYAALKLLRPGILGALLDAVVCALKNMPNTRLATLPRMADFVKWVTAAEPALGWAPGTFLNAYHEVQDEANEVALEEYPIVDSLRRLMEGEERWEGKASQLLTELAGLTEEQAVKAERWPRGANILSGELKRLAPNLRKIGLNVTFSSAGRGHAKVRQITVEKVKVGERSSPSSPGLEKQGSGDDLPPDGDNLFQSGDDGGDDLGSVRKAYKNRPGDDGDDGDVVFPAFTSPHIRERDNKQRRGPIRIERNGNRPSEPSEPSECTEKPPSGADGRDDVSDGMDGVSDGSANNRPKKTCIKTGVSDGSDGLSPTLSEPHSDRERFEL